MFIKKSEYDRLKDLERDKEEFLKTKNSLRNEYTKTIIDLNNKIDLLRSDLELLKQKNKNLTLKNLNLDNILIQSSNKKLSDEYQSQVLKETEKELNIYKNQILELRNLIDLYDWSTNYMSVVQLKNYIFHIINK